MNSPWAGRRFDLPWPPARNPWNPEHFTAGSSSGTGAAVAAGHDPGRHRLRHRRLDPRAGGAVRHRRHQADLRPVLSRAGVLPLSYTLDHTGPMAWTVEDCALLLQAMAGHDPADPASADRPVPDFTAGLRQGREGAAHRRGRGTSTRPTTRSATPRCRGIDDALAQFRATWAPRSAT